MRKKSQLRQKYTALRNALSPEKIEEKSLQVSNRLLELAIWEYEFYHLYLSIAQKKEVDTEFILSILQGKDKNVVLPKSNIADHSLTHFLLTDATVIKPNAWNIPEPVSGVELSPQQIEVVFVPLLAFDQQGNRLGYGKGFYDKFLRQCRPETLKIGLSFFEAEAIIPIEKHDVKLNYCVTPESIYQFSR
ncbi:5-formyltetrahydrofolate cyclo-ligase [Gangjinia marincola]|uniref:5-formyltetrahydrofolate cyclo-ligase n=1 Tax=Gangjinia marincola TaxID=578463 RepID=A0ABN1MIC1_9FLAO